nr:peptidylprolyl isomerase [Variovorax terrae]
MTPPPAALPPAVSGAPRVRLGTSMGDIVFELYPDKAPQSVENFLQYVREHQYEGTVFHRVIDGFMIQGGGFTADLREKSTRAPIPLEAANGLRNERGTLAMARTSNPHSATAQFFINVRDNEALNAKGAADGYAVFGRVIAGMDVVDSIRTVPTASRSPYHNVPVTPVVINTATLEK